jgi:two-component system CheB/CheR fusion protein
VESVPPELLEKYFERVGDRHVFRPDLRRAVIMGRNNLTEDAPISRLDLLMCRNTLMYLTAETQAHILRHFQFALRDSGLLVLGRSEMLVAQRSAFAPVDLRQRIFRRLPRRDGQSRLTDLAGPEPALVSSPQTETRTRDAALDLAPQPQLIVSAEGVLVLANQAARRLFRIQPEEVGRPLWDLSVAVRPADLRRAVQRAQHERVRVALGEVRHRPYEGDPLTLDVSVTPLAGDEDELLGVLVGYEDVTRLETLREELATSRRDLELAYEELQSTIDELETTNEELQSANEELQTTNEELQTTNEELETMNEELQASNEELERMNEEMRARTREASRVNELLESILASLGVAVTVLDADECVQVWNDHAVELWGVRSDEAVDEKLLALDIGLPLERVAPALRAVLAGASSRESIELDAVNRRGRPVVVQTTVLSLVGAPGGRDGHPPGAIVLMEARPSGAATVSEGQAAEGRA